MTQPGASKLLNRVMRGAVDKETGESPSGAQGPREPPPEAYGMHADGTPVGTDAKPRCRNCAKVLAWYVSRPWSIKCPRCGATSGLA